MAAETHAVLSASGADRWIHCPGSVALTKDMPDTGSEYAAEGSLAHAIAELKMRKQFLEPMGRGIFTRRMNKLKADPHYAEEMQGHTDTYVDHIVEIANSLSSPPLVDVERKVDFSQFVPGGFGTADCILIHGNDLWIVDFKYGRGVLVDPHDNPQLMLYAVGAVLAYSWIYDIQNVHLCVVQPRGDGIKEAEISRDALMDWVAFTAAPAAKIASEGSDEYHAGDWCRFCKARATCRERATTAVSAVEDFGGKLPPELTPAEFGDLLNRIDALSKYASDAKDYALQALLRGENIPYWKLVEGRKSRAWDDQDAAFKALRDSGIEDAVLYERVPLTIAKLEKQLGKKAVTDAAGSYITYKPGKPTLVPVDDPRDAFSLNASAEEDFKN